MEGANASCWLLSPFILSPSSFSNLRLFAFICGFFSAPLRLCASAFILL
jgi:hypothetical protein